MLSTSLVALDSTILATAVPAIVDDLGGFSQFPWLFSIYLLAQAVSTPIYGRLSDVLGRKPIILVGIGLFLLGSILCGVAWSMPALIVFRVLQGLGAGAIQPMGITIAGDIYTLRERAVAQGYLASVWGISSVIGPALGGLFSDFLSWRWIFFVNIPLCLIAAFILTRNYKEKVAKGHQRIDYLGAGLLASGTTLLILGLLEGGQAWDWNSATSIAIFVAAALLLIVFVIVERRVAQPILPLWVFQRRVLLASSIISAGVGAVVLGLSSYIPTFAQEVLGASALVAGFALAVLTIGWPIAAAQAGRLYLPLGFRATSLAGSVLVVIGTAAMLLLGLDSAIWEVALFCLVVGLGMGLVAAPSLIAAQTSVDWSERGVVTGANLFSRSIGSAIGVAVFGAIVNATTSDGSGTPTPNELAGGMHTVFIVITVIALGILAASFFMPKHVHEATPAPGTAPAPA
jgi:EmrB/QacA subfamily drug resistance transporter